LGWCGLGLNCVQGLCLELGPDVTHCSDEQSANALCHAEAICVDLEGSPACTCRSGLFGDGQDCYPDSHCGNAEVQQSPASCHIKANCTPRAQGPTGAADCVCIEGFVGDGTSCEPE
jgi:hypothetical protein